MNRSELISELDKLNVPKNIYDLKESSPRNQPNLKNYYGQWKVYNLDGSGIKSAEATFESESDALNYMLKIFRSRFNYEKRDQETIRRNLFYHTHGNFAELGKYFRSFIGIMPKKFDHFYRSYNGLEGQIGKHTTISFWTVQKIVNFDFTGAKNWNSEFLFFGNKNNSDVYYAFDRNQPGIYQLSLAEGQNTTPVYCADDMDSFLLFLFDQSVK